jgi:uncharacterized membrane protein YjjP (DUF1212 family)
VLLNLRWVFKEKGQLVFLVGILVFLSGHIVYLAAVLPMAKNWMVPVAVGVVLTALLMKWIFIKITAKKAFKIFGIFYIGAIMILVPGFLFTNSLRDVIYGDTMSGLNRLVQVVIIAVALAFGTNATPRLPWYDSPTKPKNVYCSLKLIGI